MAGEDEFKQVGEDRRLGDLDAQLARLEAAEAQRTGVEASVTTDANYRMGNRVLADLIGGIGGGILLGWLFDRVFGTAPWGFLVLMLMGIIVAFRNVMRIAGKTTTERPPESE